MSVPSTIRRSPRRARGEARSAGITAAPSPTVATLRGHPSGVRSARSLGRPLGQDGRGVSGRAPAATCADGWPCPFARPRRRTDASAALRPQDPLQMAALRIEDDRWQAAPMGADGGQSGPGELLGRGTPAPPILLRRAPDARPSPRPGGAQGFWAGSGWHPVRTAGHARSLHLKAGRSLRPRRARDPWAERGRRPRRGGRGAGGSAWGIAKGGGGVARHRGSARIAIRSGDAPSRRSFGPRPRRPGARDSSVSGIERPRRSGGTRGIGWT